jgi:RHS repeat-associated protein
MKAPRCMLSLAVGLLIVVVENLISANALAQDQPPLVHEFEYDAKGNLIRDTSVVGVEYLSQYDKFDRLERRVLPAPVQGAPHPTIQFGYDQRDQLVKVADPRSNTTRYSIDGHGNHLTQTSPDTGLTRNTFDSAGNVLSTTDARGYTTAFEYDQLMRVVRVKHPSGPATSFEYDTGSPGAIGRIAKMIDASGTTLYEYDESGRLVSKVQAISGPKKTNSYRLSYRYGSDGGASGKITEVIYPSGNKVTSSYDSSGRISSMSVVPFASGAEIALLSSVKYEPFGPPSSWVWGRNGPPYTRGYDLAGRLVSYPLGHLEFGGVTRTLEYDEAGRIKATKHRGEGSAPLLATALDHSYTYDSLNRIQSFQSLDSQQRFRYDENSNRIFSQFGANVYTNKFDPDSNKFIASNGPFPPKNNRYDATGNLLADGARSYAYNDRGRLVEVRSGSTLVSYTYNGLGQRVQKSGDISIIPTGVSQFFYDESGRMLGEYDANRTFVEETVFLGDLPVAVLKNSNVPVRNSISVYELFADHIRTPRVITDPNNNIVWRWDLADPFGLTPPLESIVAGRRFVYNRRFPGQYFDAESSLHYNYYRDYDPQSGRYIQSDPIGLTGGINTYGYVEQDPVSKFDATGLQSEGSLSPRPGRLPMPGDVFVPGTAANNAFSASVNRIIKETKALLCEDETPCPPCSPPAGEKFNKVTHYISHSQDADKGSHGCQQLTGSPVHWHYSVNHQNAKTCQCFTEQHAFGGCGVAPN